MDAQEAAAERWNAVVRAANDRDWDRLGACLAPNVVQHQAKQRLGGTAVQYEGLRPSLRVTGERPRI